MQTYKGIFEAHITVAPLNEAKLTEFQLFCAVNNLKPIQIELARGDFALQQMTASVYEGNFSDVLTEVKQMAVLLGRQGFEVKRVKLEASPFNEGLPAHLGEVKQHPTENYFEHHLKLMLPNGDVQESLYMICQKHHAHLSRNAFKQYQEGVQERFVTLRHYALGRQEAEAALHNLKDELTENGFQILKTITEYCVYDDHVGLDLNWLELYSPCETCNNACILSPV